MIEFNPGSSQMVSALLFGGTIKDSEVQPSLDKLGNPILIKTGINAGQLKTKKVEVLRVIKGLGIEPDSNWANKKDGVYSTKDEVLQFLKISLKDQNAKEVVNCFLKIRELSKQIQTYYISIQDLIFEKDDCVHACFQHVSTDTSRLSCNKPNIQNVPTNYSLVKQHFTSRFSNGQIISADYKQIEPTCQAQMCQDPGLIADIVNDTDIYCKYLSYITPYTYEDIYKWVKVDNLPEWERQRSQAKTVVLAGRYGAGIAKRAQQSGLSEEQVKELISAEEQAYPKLKLWNDWNTETIKKQGWYKDPWGRRYNFKKYPAPDWLQKKGIKENYSPTEIKNYINQGFATGTIVLIMLGKFWRTKVLNNRDKYLLINTVHDSVMLDCKEQYINDAKKDLQILEEVGKISLENFNYKMNVPITIDIKSGNSWFEC